MPRSMTSFARTETQQSWGALSCEIRSVNHRYLEPHFRLPDAFKSLETQLREALKKSLSRGKIEVNIQFRAESTDEAEFTLNDTLAKKIIALSEGIDEYITRPAKLRSLDILQWPGVLQAPEMSKQEFEAQTLSLFDEALQKLIGNRNREGHELGQFIEQRLVDISQFIVQLRQNLPEIYQQHQNKLREKLDTLKIDIDEDRYNQEVVYMLQKTDVAEEIDRLAAHVTEVRHSLKQKGPIGRRLDFLMQEFNREANTLSSKSISSETSQIAVELKVLIEQMREQVQNIE